MKPTIQQNHCNQPAVKTPKITTSRRKKERIVGGKMEKYEAVIQDEICDYLTSRGLVHSITDSSVGFANGRKLRAKVSKPGWCDVTGLLPDGRFLGIEVKSSTGKLRPSQVQTLGEITASNGLVIVARSVGEVVAVVEPYLWEWQKSQGRDGLGPLAAGDGTLSLPKTKRAEAPSLPPPF